MGHGYERRPLPQMGPPEAAPRGGGAGFGRGNGALIERIRAMRDGGGADRLRGPQPSTETQPSSGTQPSTETQPSTGTSLSTGTTSATQPASDATTAQPAATLGRTAINEAALTAVTTSVYAVVPAEYQDADAQAGLSAVLREAALAGITNTSQVAYILATAEHESRFGHRLYERSESLVEDRNAFSSSTRRNRKTHRETTTWSATVHTNNDRVTAGSEAELETAYWDSAYGGRLGNVSGTTDARDFRGRGFVQLTGRVNYERMSQLLNGEGFSYTLDGTTYGGAGNAAIDLAAHPDHVNRSRELAARVEVKGMMEGIFTGTALGDHVAGGATEATHEDYEGARAVVNGDGETNGSSIADIAVRYAGVLNAGSAWATVFPAPKFATPEQRA